MIRPSSAHRWSKCPGSVTAESGRPNIESDAAKEGTAAHWLAEQVLISYRDGKEIFDPRSIKYTFNGVEIDDEMIEAVDLYVTEILKTVNSFGGLQKLMIEQELSIERVHPDLKGTIDAWAYDEKAGVVYVWDFKYGRRVVNHFHNVQLHLYSIAAVDSLGVDDAGLTIKQTIVQPRAYHVLGSVRTSELRGYMLNIKAKDLHQAAYVATSGSDERQSGEHCHYCLANADCSTFTMSAYNAIDFNDKAGDCMNLTPNQLALMITQLRAGKSRIDDLLSALEDEAGEKIAKGDNVPGYDNGEGRSSKVWDVPDEQIIAIGDMMGADLRKEGVKTPTQSKKLIDESVINDYIKVKPGKRKLIRTDETLAYHVFKSTK